MLAAACLFALLLILLGWGRQTLWSLRLARHFPLRPLAEDSPETVWPHAVILLPVRGADPMLTHCLTGLCQQDHPDFSIFIVLDQEDDPSLPIIREVQEKFPHAPITILPLVNRLETCSLKVSAILTTCLSYAGQAPLTRA
ncbi:MAG: hypothetical protein ACKO23_03655 [Gemmataceae bacterium]